MVFNLAYTQVNITPYVDEIKNLSGNLVYSAFQTYTLILGVNIFWTFIFSMLGLGLFIGTKKNMLVTFAYFCGVTVICAGAMLPVAILILGFISAFMGASLLFKALVRKS